MHPMYVLVRVGKRERGYEREAARERLERERERESEVTSEVKQRRALLSEHSPKATHLLHSPTTNSQSHR